MTEKFTRAPVREVETHIPRFRIEQGLRPEIVDQLVVKSRQPTILEACPNDAAERFRDPDSVYEWLQKGREAYTLSPRKNLGGLAWYGEKPFPLHADRLDMAQAPQHTFGIRLYDSFRGRGLAKPFMDDTLRDYLQTLYLQGTIDRFQGLWLSTRVSNEGAVRLYHEYGYRDFGFVNQDGVNEVIMILSNTVITDKILGT